MKKIIKIWDILLLAILSLLGVACNQRPEPEYGVVPMYGVEAVENIEDSKPGSVEQDLNNK